MIEYIRDLIYREQRSVLIKFYHAFQLGKSISNVDPPKEVYDLILGYLKKENSVVMLQIIQKLSTEVVANLQSALECEGTGFYEEIMDKLHQSGYNDLDYSEKYTELYLRRKGDGEALPTTVGQFKIKNAYYNFDDESMEEGFHLNLGYHDSNLYVRMEPFSRVINFSSYDDNINISEYGIDFARELFNAIGIHDVELYLNGHNEVSYKYKPT